MPAGSVATSGTINANSTSSSAPAAGSTVELPTNGVGTTTLQLTGTWVGTVILEGLLTGQATDWVAVPATTLAGVPATNLTANGAWTFNGANFLKVRTRSTAWTSGAANVTLLGSSEAAGGGGSGGGGGGGGAVTVADGANVVEGTTTDAGVQGDVAGTLSAKLRGLNTGVILRAGAAVIGAVTQSGTWNVGVTGTAAVTQSGTWTVQQGGTPTAVANAWPIKLTDGTNTAAVKAASTAALATDPAAVVSLSPNSPLPTGSNVVGAVTQSGTWTVGLAAGAAVIGAVTQSGTWNVTVNTALPTGANVIGGVTQSGTWNVTVNTALPTGANTIGAVTQASGPWTVQGQVAAAAATSGTNPLVMGANDTANNAQFLRTLLNNTDGINASVQYLLCMANAYDSNGTTSDRHRNNVDVTLLTSAARTTTQTSADIVTYNCQAIFVTLDMTTVGTASVTVTINYKDPASGKYILLLSGAAITTNSTNMYKIDPRGPTAVANVSAWSATGRILQIIVTANNANSGTYSAGYTLIPC